MPTGTMPFRGEPCAPSFSGRDDGSLLEFFDCFEVLAEECSLVEEEKCQGILRYVDFRTKQLWLTFSSSESSDYQKFKAEVLYQYPIAWKVAQRRAAQPADRRFSDKNGTSVQSMPCPARNVPVQAVSHPRLSELSPAAAPFRPAPVGHYPIPRARHDHAVPPSRARSVYAAPVDAAPPPFTFGPVTVPFVFNPAPLPFPLCPTPALSASVTVPSLPSPIEFRPRAATTAPSASVTAQVQPSFAEAKCLELAPARCDSRQCRLPAVPALGNGQNEEVECSLHSCQEEAEDVAVQKEEGRVEQVTDMSSDDEDEQYRVIEKHQELETQQGIALPQPDEDTERDCKSEYADEQRDTADEGRTWITDEDGTRIAAEDRSRIADENQGQETAVEWRKVVDAQKVEHAVEKCWTVDEDSSRVADEEPLAAVQRQEKVEQMLQKNLEVQIDTLPAPILVPVSLPAPEPPPEVSAAPDTRIAFVSPPSQHEGHCLEYYRLIPACHVSQPCQIIARKLTECIPSSTEHEHLSTTELLAARTRQLAERGGRLTVARDLASLPLRFCHRPGAPPAHHHLRSRSRASCFQLKSPPSALLLSRSSKLLKSRSSVAKRRSCRCRACGRKSTGSVDIRSVGEV